MPPHRSVGSGISSVAALPGPALSIEADERIAGQLLPCPQQGSRYVDSPSIGVAEESIFLSIDDIYRLVKTQSKTNLLPLHTSYTI